MSFERDYSTTPEEDPFYDPGQATTGPPPPPSPYDPSSQPPVNGTDQAWRNPEGGRQYWDLDYWLRKGVTYEDMFDTNGQLRPNWRHTQYGYDRATTTLPPLVPPPTVQNFTPNGGGPAAPTTIAAPAGADGEMASVFDWPGFESAGAFVPRDTVLETRPAPVADPFVFEDAPAYQNFSYDPYVGSSWVDAEKEPGYDASRNQLRKQIEAGAAHRGMLRSGMTIGDLYTGLDSLGQQNFANFDNRNFRNYSANRDNAFTAHQANAANKFQEWQGNRNSKFDAWQANGNNRFQAWQGDTNADAQKFGLELGADRDIHDRKATDVDRGNNYRYNVASSQFQDMLSRWQERVRSLTSIATAGANS